jgi:hypothetical protein
MTAKAQTINQTPSSTKESIKAQLWQFERQLLAKALDEDARNALIADDFVQFDESGDARDKSGESATLTGEISPLWAHFGSANSCCLAYLVPQSDGSSAVCMALWIFKADKWQKTFHHQNLNYQ